MRGMSIVSDEWLWSDPWHQHTDAIDTLGVLVEALRRAIDIRDLGTNPKEPGGAGTADAGTRALLLVDLLNAAIAAITDPILETLPEPGRYQGLAPWELLDRFRSDGLA